MTGRGANGFSGGPRDTHSPGLALIFHGPFGKKNVNYRNESWFYRPVPARAEAD
jgi:hypothetical protein